MTDIKQGWELKRFEEILGVNQIGLVRNAKEQGKNLKYRYLKMDSISADNELIEGKHVYVEASDEEVLKYSLDEGDFLFNTRNSYELVGKTCIYEPKIKEVTLFNNNIMRVKFKNGISSKFINYAFSSDFVKEKLEKLKSGTTSVVGIYFNGLKNLPIPLPPLSEQLRIVSILDEAFTAIATAKANAEQNLKNAKELFESYLQGVFEKNGEGWEETILEKEIELLVGYAFKSKDYTELDGDVSLLRGDNIMQGELRWEDVKRWPKSQYDDFKKFQLRENDIVLAMDRPWVKAGLKCARLAKNDLPALLLQRTACLRNKSKIDNSFLYYIIKSKGFMSHLLSVQGGIGVPHISGQQILDFAFNKPSIKQQQIIVQNLDALSAETKRLESIYQQKLINLEELKKSVLQKAFNGEL